MSINLLKALTRIPQFLHDAQLLDSDIARLSAPGIAAELVTNPVVDAAVNKFSAEWRTVENDEISVKKSSLFTMMPNLTHLFRHAGALEADVSGAMKDPSLAEALASCPRTSAALSDIYAQYKTAAGDIS